MDSSRLPKKVLRKIGKKPMLHHVIKQTLASKIINEVIIATTKEKIDDSIIDYCKQNKIKVFRGSKMDLLDRYFQCAKKYDCDPIIRITSDCPLIDPNVIDKIISEFIKKKYDYLANNLEKIKGKWNNSMCNFPQGMTVEVSTYSALEKAWKEAKKPSEREHVFPYIQFNPQIFKVNRIKYHKDLSYIRCTVDRINDLKFIRKIYNLLPNKKYITISDIEQVINQNPKLVSINNKIPFDEGYQISLIEDKKQGLKNVKNTSKNIVIRVDADNQLGMGHFYRSLNLAKKIKNKNIQVTFLTKSPIVVKLTPKDIPVVKLPMTKIKKQKKILSFLKPDILIIDKREESSALINLYKQHSKKVWAIDYTSKNKKMIKYGINMLYPKTGIKGKNSFSGLEYSILNESFIKTKKLSVSKKVKKLLVLQGGADTFCFTPKIVDSINQINENISITIVLGPSFKCKKELYKITKNSKNQLKILQNVKNMSSLMKKHDIAITGGGMTLLELAHLGIPSIVICGAKFENETASMMQKAGFAINLGYNKKWSKAKLISAVKELIYDYNLRKKMNKNGRKLIDGNGMKRIEGLILKEI